MVNHGSDWLIVYHYSPWCWDMGASINGGTPTDGWCVRETPTQMDDDWGYPYFGNLHVLHGAGIFANMTGWFCLGKCRFAYTSTMEHISWYDLAMIVWTKISRTLNIVTQKKCTDYPIGWHGITIMLWWFGGRLLAMKIFRGNDYLINIQKTSSN